MTMLKIFLPLLLTSTMVIANVDFDALDDINEPTQNQSQVENDLKTFESSLENNVDIDNLEPAAGFKDLDNSLENENIK